MSINSTNTNLKLSQNSRDVGFIGEVGQDLQLQKISGEIYLKVEQALEIKV